MKGGVRVLLLMPSFYALLTFPVFYFLYSIDIFPFEDGNVEAHLLIIAAIVFYITSTLFFFPIYKKFVPRFIESRYTLFNKLSKIEKRILISLFLIGLLGTVLYIKDFSDYFGGVWLFFLFLTTDSAQIRIAAGNYTSIGFQLTYLAWASATIFFVDANQKNIKKTYYLSAFLIFVSNLLFIDRTRPLTILFVTFIFLFFARFKKIKRKALFRVLILIPTILLAMYVIIGEWVGKEVKEEDDYGKTVLPKVLQSAVLYGTTSFAYFNRIVANEKYDYVPSRSLYPAQKLFSSVGIAAEPPPQVNEFYFIPQPVNVGTFLEPLYRDGGFIYCILGILLHSVFFNILALFFLKYSNRFGIYALCLLCLCNFFAFFTPKFNNMPIWIFVLIGIGTTIWEKIRALTQKRWLLTSE